MIDRPNILLLEGTLETIALGTGSALSVLVGPYQDAHVEYSPQVHMVEDSAGMHMQLRALRIPGGTLAELRGIHRTIHGDTATLSSWVYSETEGTGRRGENWGWHRCGLEYSAVRTPLFSLNHGDGIGWLLGSHQQLMWANHLNTRAGREVEQMVFSRENKVSSLALTADNLRALELDLLREGKKVQSWMWTPDDGTGDFWAP